MIILVKKTINGHTDLLFVVQCHSDVLKQLFPIKIGCFMSGIDATKATNTGTGESFVFRITEKTVDSWFWKDTYPSIYALFSNNR